MAKGIEFARLHWSPLSHVDRRMDYQPVRGRRDQNRIGRAWNYHAGSFLGHVALARGVRIAAAIGGALMGAGPTFRLLPLHVGHRHIEIRSPMRGGACPAACQLCHGGTSCCRPYPTAPRHGQRNLNGRVNQIHRQYHSSPSIKDIDSRQTQRCCYS